MKTQVSKMVSLEDYRQLESACRLWMAACEARDSQLQQLEQECQALRQRVARLTRQLQRQASAPKTRKEARLAR